MLAIALDFLHNQILASWCKQLAITPFIRDAQQQISAPKAFVEQRDRVVRDLSQKGFSQTHLTAAIGAVLCIEDHVGAHIIKATSCSIEKASGTRYPCYQIRNALSA